MKKLNYLLLGLTVLGMVTFTSCEDEEEGDKLPDVSFKGGADYISANSTLIAGEQFKIGVTATPNADSQEELVRLTLTRTFNNVPTTIVDTALDKLSSMSVDITLYANEGIGEERFYIEVEDKAGEIGTLELVITTEAGALTLKSYSAVLMGAQSKLNLGSYLDADLGLVYLKADAETKDSEIDIIYYYGSTNLATLVAPDDATVNGGAGNLDMATNLNPKNATRFNTNPGITTSAFDAMTDDAAIADLTMTALKVTQLKENDVIAFQTALGRKGVIKVGAITTGADGQIKIDVKIQ